MHTDYINPAIRELRDQQVRFAPRDKKIEQADRAERLLWELEPDRAYSYQYLCFRITKYRPESYPDMRLTGEEAAHDLRLFVEDLSEAANLRVEEVGEPVLTVEQLSKQLNVSTKTISRWRHRGLVSRRFVFDGRKRVGFLSSSVERFVERNRERVRRGAAFSQLTEEERQQIIDRARRMARAGGCPAEVTRRLSRQMGRSVETIRYTLKQFDQDHPDLAIFPDTSGPLREETKRKIYQQYRRGESVEALARKFCRTKTSIYRVIGEMRARRIMELPLDYIPNESFAQVRTARQEQEILGPPPPNPEPPRKPRLPSGLPPYLASLYEVPLLTREQEVHLFRKMNYLKYKARKLREKLDPARPKSRLMDEIERLYDEAVATKNEIISANLRLVVSIAKRHAGPVENFFELVSDGNMSLIRAVEKFDYARGNKFSTYASWAIMKNFARTIPDEHRHRDRFRTSQSEMFATAEDQRTDQYELEAAQMRREAQVGKMLERLDQREREIIIKRFGLVRGQEPLTLKEVGAELGVTKERIRQIEARALEKLRKAAQKERIEIPGLE
ncbi:MAG TPA: sigma-70 family RNA polymerase sigma factor [Planctomycetaceae bacterium]|nr:sigma-70 family RNA polymerase sigma factor [Planctomycetaceae bacterium]HIQ20681.1 sigma-70 family RNA polymerase sigma factor [Planctomycetota bacterium]